ncbi:hypothetical protein CIW52_00335 [Mycolicibacterium sp. P9-64]|uniref:DUF6199 family natural product biosynthesis protein n=1 Tax=Mycolicibacterium sp. P9-64 TaxID=2024612 RepID=UPI0011ED76C5|nr:DUF6199 family natural product biosynthesis protein [Mycolicibacterium sp. P9-64]KAA0086435.1 hypothetical protein CIW52_00335 [Mycolicibacterium sp. P9-64]
MGFAIVVLLIGVPLTALMWFKPRALWRATESWKFRDPEANEPSDFAYRLSAIGTAAGTALLTVMALTWPDSVDTASTSKTSTTSAYSSRTSTTLALPPPTAFMPPPGMTRGSLPMIGYLTTPQPDGTLIATVYLWAPEVTSKIPAGNPPPPAPCELGPKVRGAGTDHVTVDVDLVWQPTTTSGLPMNYDCSPTRGHQVRRSYVVGPVSASAKLFTSQPEADTPLPRLAEVPGPLGDPAPG